MEDFSPRISPSYVYTHMEIQLLNPHFLLQPQYLLVRPIFFFFFFCNTFTLIFGVFCFVSLTFQQCKVLVLNIYKLHVTYTLNPTCTPHKLLVTLSRYDTQNLLMFMILTEYNYMPLYYCLY